MPRIILIGGGSSSGKSYVARNVIKNVGEENVTHITRDDYYRDQTNRTNGMQSIMTTLRHLTGSLGESKFSI